MTCPTFITTAEFLPIRANSGLGLSSRQQIPEVFGDGLNYRPVWIKQLVRLVPVARGHQSAQWPCVK